MNDLWHILYSDLNPVMVLPSQIMGSIVKTWPGFITPTALFSAHKQHSVFGQNKLCNAYVHKSSIFKAPWNMCSSNSLCMPDVMHVFMLTCIMWYIGCCVKEFMDSMTTVASHHRKSISLRMFLNDVPQLTISYTRLHCMKMTRHTPLVSCPMLQYSPDL